MKNMKKIIFPVILVILALSGCSEVSKNNNYTNSLKNDGALSIPLSSYILETKGTQIWYDLSSWENGEKPEVNGAFIIKKGKGAYYELDSDDVDFSKLVSKDKDEQEKLIVAAYHKKLKKKISEIKQELEEEVTSTQEQIKKFKKMLI